jgi:hypothetical protein
MRIKPLLGTDSSGVGKYAREHADAASERPTRSPKKGNYTCTWQRGYDEATLSSPFRARRLEFRLRAVELAAAGRTPLKRRCSAA